MIGKFILNMLAEEEEEEEEEEVNNKLSKILSSFS
jgi:hypothetical protein